MAKGGPAPASKKADAKAKAKAVEDKTFGMKNKNKSVKAQKYIQSLESAAKNTGDRAARRAEEEAKKAREAKKEAEKEKAELAKLIKPVFQIQKVPFGVDPKTIVCQYFKAGACAKGDKCKFSHDLAQERKTSKINVYEDVRGKNESGADGEDASGGAGPAILTEDSMADWDQSKLEQVVTRKHKNRPTTTDIVCKYFLDAIEQKKYGWFWECPNGGDACKYKHALPPGFVLKSASVKASSKDEENEISLEEFLEVERYRIKKETPVTAESFARWKLDRKRRADEEEAKQRKVRDAEVRAGRLGNVSGRDLFAYQPDLFADDDDAASDVDYSKREDDADVEIEDASVFLGEDLENLELDSEDECESEDEHESENVDVDDENESQDE